ncbi:MAG TPA: DsbA family protein [Myxococcaceae bacterium]|nr:DsbA family protein [Myxococcaceae bacterium]
MNRPRRPVEIWLYQDVLCAWTYIACARLAELRREFGAAVRWTFRPYALRTAEELPSAAEISGWIRDLEMARKEPEGARLSSELWRTGDPPASRIAPLIAVEAAGIQGAAAGAVYADALRRAALEQGVNVARADVALELAGSLGLEMNRFSAAYHSIQMRRFILDEHRMARERGISGVPTLVIDRRWMISGLRNRSEYRRHILACMAKLGTSTGGSPERMLH